MRGLHWTVAACVLLLSGCSLNDGAIPPFAVGDATAAWDSDGPQPGPDSSRPDGTTDAAPVDTGLDTDRADTDRADTDRADTNPADTSPPDTGPSPLRSCEDMYGRAADYSLCNERAEDCEFVTTLGAVRSCESTCTGLGGVCLGTYQNPEGIGNCFREATITCDAVRNDNICVCSREP